MLSIKTIREEDAQAPLPEKSATETRSNKHVIQEFFEARDAGKGPNTMIIGHRGGYIDGPENSMRCFKAAIDNNLDGIEFDVSTQLVSD